MRGLRARTFSDLYSLAVLRVSSASGPAALLRQLLGAELAGREGGLCPYHNEGREPLLMTKNRN